MISSSTGTVTMNTKVITGNVGAANSDNY